jgi:hypothetical protein
VRHLLPEVVCLLGLPGLFAWKPRQQSRSANLRETKTEIFCSTVKFTLANPPFIKLLLEIHATIFYAIFVGNSVNTPLRISLQDAG